MSGALVLAGFFVAVGLVTVAYAIAGVAKALYALTEQLQLGVRLTEQTPESALGTEAEPRADGVTAWPGATGWEGLRAPARPADNGDEAPQPEVGTPSQPKGYTGV